MTEIDQSAVIKIINGDSTLLKAQRERLVKAVEGLQADPIDQAVSEIEDQLDLDCGEDDTVLERLEVIRDKIMMPQPALIIDLVLRELMGTGFYELSPMERSGLIDRLLDHEIFVDAYDANYQLSFTDNFH